MICSQEAAVGAEIQSGSGLHFNFSIMDKLGTFCAAHRYCTPV